MAHALRIATSHESDARWRTSPTASLPSWLARRRASSAAAAVSTRSGSRRRATRNGGSRASRRSPSARSRWQPTACARADRRSARVPAGGRRAAELVFVNGRYRAAAVTLGALPRGVTCREPGCRARPSGRSVEAASGAHRAVRSHPFVALNTAFLRRRRAIVHVPDGVDRCEEPIHLLFVSTAPDDAADRCRILAC